MNYGNFMKNCKRKPTEKIREKNQNLTMQNSTT